MCARLCVCASHADMHMHSVLTFFFPEQIFTESLSTNKEVKTGAEVTQHRGKKHIYLTVKRLLPKGFFARVLTDLPL